VSRHIRHGVHLRFWLDSGFPSGDGCSQHRGAGHRTHRQSEEVGLRHHHVPQITSQEAPAKGELGPPPGLSACVDCGHRHFQRAWRAASQCTGQFDRLLLAMHNATRCPTMSRSDCLHQGPGVVTLARGSGLAATDTRCIQRVMRRRVCPRHRRGNSPATKGRCRSETNMRFTQGSVLPTKSRGSQT
jgi:hypothetical protein